MIEKAVKKELTTLQPQSDPKGDGSLSECFVRYVEQTERKFIFVIDEWDALIREAKDDEVVAAAFMTGILSIKKDVTQSAISDLLLFTADFRFRGKQL